MAPAESSSTHRRRLSAANCNHALLIQAVLPLHFSDIVWGLFCAAAFVFLLKLIIMIPVHERLMLQIYCKRHTHEFAHRNAGQGYDWHHPYRPRISLVQRALSREAEEPVAESTELDAAHFCQVLVYLGFGTLDQLLPFC